MRACLTGICLLTVAASGWLGVMFVALHRPGFERGVAISALFVVQSLLALAVANRWLIGRPWTFLAPAGAVGLIWAGGQAILTNLSSSHFEGYALLIGFLLTLQGILTLVTSSSKVHQFGN
ncbi:MAG TPA: hypothetical protein VN628_07430 [Vicinamibacterales bacterium]|nr:hypothetical protein [Vicinamibacterales bacterium]